ncbi:MAG: hypothetical protein ONB44_07660 [candidate division KSB1 bacterium]|nr:hypothetical protein [candidate division KSB1 bacterium]MDZ7302003.1 hypothetical protein [candidate division KSB1 bacterium]MDZ7310185.1 hypothetical protein [candidate division KSB1 bacterium]
MDFFPCFSIKELVKFSKLTKCRKLRIRREAGGNGQALLQVGAPASGGDDAVKAVFKAILGNGNLN